MATISKLSLKAIIIISAKRYMIFNPMQGGHGTNKVNCITRRTIKLAHISCVEVSRNRWIDNEDNCTANYGKHDKSI